MFAETGKSGAIAPRYRGKGKPPPAKRCRMARSCEPKPHYSIVLCNW